MTAPRIVHWQRKGQPRVTLVRAERNPNPTSDSDYVKDVTVNFTQAEWWLLRRTVLAEFGLVQESTMREQLGVAYEETERANVRVRHLEEELDYAATGEEPEGDTDE